MNHLMKLTPNQKLAVESIDKPTAIIAGAGSGKTEVLIGRLLHLLQKEKIALNQILCVTFTEKAAKQLKEKIAHNLTDEIKVQLPWAPIGTFHSFCLDLVKEQAPLLGLSEWVSVWDEHTVKLAIHRHCRKVLLKALEEKQPAAILLTEELEFRQALMLLEELMHFRWHAEKYLTRDYGLGTRDQEKKLLEATKSLYRQILSAYDEEKRERQSLDFQDLEILALGLLRQNKAVLKNYQERFKHILIDEVQDINDLQRELVELLFNPKKNCLCIVGDPKQSIYRFRGANVEGFHKIVDLILKAGGHQIELQENFRSRPAVLKFINHTFEHLFSPEERSSLVATRSEEKQSGVAVLSIESVAKVSKEEARRQEANVIAQYILSYVEKEGGNFGDIALLFQSLTEARHYEQALRSLGIPYRLFGGRGFLNAQEVIDLLFCLKLIVDPKDRLALFGLMRSPLVGLPDTVITKLALEHPDDPEKVFMKLPEAKWFQQLFDQKESLSGAEILEQVVSQTHYDSFVDQLDPSGCKLANIEQLIELTRALEIKEEMPLKELLEYFDELKKRRTPMASASAVDVSSLEACQIMTVHAAKGLQFPVVILPDLMRAPPTSGKRFLFLREEGIAFSLKEEPQNPFSEYIPTATMNALKEKEKHQDLAERKRLLYVALTRTEEKVVIPWHSEIRQTGPWYAWLKESIEKIPATTGFFLKSPKMVASSSFATFNQLMQENQLDEIPYYTATELEELDRGSPLKDEIPLQNDHFGGTDLGNLVHAILKEMKEKKEISPGLIKKNLFDLEMVATQKEIHSTFQLLEQFLNSDLAPPVWDGEHELPFRLKLPDGFITGTIDYAYQTKEGWIVCDFKTDSKMEPEKYQLQMDIYALALSKGQPKPVLETRLLFLKAGKVKIEGCTPERLIKTEERLIKLLNSLKVGGNDRSLSKTN